MHVSEMKENFTFTRDFPSRNLHCKLEAHLIVIAHKRIDAYLEKEKSLHCEVAVLYYVLWCIKLLAVACTCMLFADNEGLNRIIRMDLVEDVGAFGGFVVSNKI